ncbi:MAG TPA: SGNH/GDSL hydrolase family protein, partial [Vicinamibacteria bacterium]|nr:SGNH/GDSL hydrolase family protein [Vicinamibacteria bacterium]
MRRRWPEIVLLLASTAVCVVVVVGIELALRLANPDYLYTIRGDESSNVYSQVYGWELRRGFRGLDLGAVATVNRRGYRGREHTVRPPPGRTRVVMLGDSIAYGAGVRDEQTFSAQLETIDPRLDVVNLAVGGYGTDQELVRLEREGMGYSPDVVLLHFCLFSDFADNGLPSALFDARQPKPYFTWDGQGLALHDAHLRLGPLAAAAQWLADDSHAYNRLCQLVGVRRAP